MNSEAVFDAVLSQRVLIFENLARKDQTKLFVWFREFLANLIFKLFLKRNL